MPHKLFVKIKLWWDIWKHRRVLNKDYITQSSLFPWVALVIILIFLQVVLQVWKSNYFLKQKCLYLYSVLN